MIDDQDYDYEEDGDGYEHICEECETELSKQPDADEPGADDIYFTCPACGHFN
jgi:hypothetical protein